MRPILCCSPWRSPNKITLSNMRSEVPRKFYLVDFGLELHRLRRGLSNAPLIAPPIFPVLRRNLFLIRKRRRNFNSAVPKRYRSRSANERNSSVIGGRFKKADLVAGAGYVGPCSVTYLTSDLCIKCLSCVLHTDFTANIMQFEMNDYNFLNDVAMDNLSCLWTDTAVYIYFKLRLILRRLILSSAKVGTMTGWLFHRLMQKQNPTGTRFKTFSTSQFLPLFQIE